ncbi:aminoglycoside N(3)-acetyltransferase [Sporolactobacillus spathodeae]|uniref:Aminoglycoside N(3)-acetyltransferase n=1 Tax=Sporolactobacillus spathodeae TaxID=1465502 RepID=A0ABS2QBI5_9BACL|nr:AAC(3) family N-acetyltransferase [Sporolactobacillus spathodeae]MBM7659125.1 aminoglycoside 3-N-acetyltransferase [Sporolactobacillus spathodeae]
MTEEEAIRRSQTAVTRSRIVEDLLDLGLKANDRVIVHTSMSKIGWVCGGTAAVIGALQDVLTEKGTLIMPAHSADVSDPADWSNPSVPRDWFDSIYREMPAFDPARTPTLGMGRVAEVFRTYPDVGRSRHPIYSFSVWGAYRDQIVDNHPYNNGLGPNSPLGAIYRCQGRVLLIGVGYRKNTSMHLGEVFSGRLKKVKRMSPVRISGERQWIHYQDWDYHEERFAEIGRHFEQEFGQSPAVRKGMIGQAPSILLDQKEVVDYTAAYLRKQRRTALQ